MNSPKHIETRRGGKAHDASYFDQHLVTNVDKFLDLAARASDERGRRILDTGRRGNPSKTLLLTMWGITPVEISNWRYQRTTGATRLRVIEFLILDILDGTSDEYILDKNDFETAKRIRRWLWNAHGDELEKFIPLLRDHYDSITGLDPSIGVHARPSSAPANDDLEEIRREFQHAETMRSDPVVMRAIARGLRNAASLLDFPPQLLEHSIQDTSITLPCSILFENHTNNPTPIRVLNHGGSTMNRISAEESQYLRKVHRIREIKYNNPTFALAACDDDNTTCDLTLQMTDYLSVIGVQDALEHEILSAAYGLKASGILSLDSLEGKLKLRTAFLAQQRDAARKYAGMAISTVVASRTQDGDYHLHVRKRSSRTAAHSNLMHVVPAGMYQFDINPEYESNLEYAVLREYAEELFKKEFDNSREDPRYILNEWEEVVSIRNMMADGRAELIHCGIIVNLLNFRPEICCALMIHDPGWFESQPVRLNWEYMSQREINIAKFEDGRAPISYFSLQRFDEQLLATDTGAAQSDGSGIVANWVPPGLAALILAQRVGKRFAR